MKLLTQIGLASLIMVKVVLAFIIFIYLVELDPLFLEGNAIASEEVQKDPEAIVKPAGYPPAIALAQDRQTGRSNLSASQGLGKRTVSDEDGGPAPHRSRSGEVGGDDENIAKEQEIDLNFLIKKESELKKEEEELEKKRAEVMAIQEEINNKIATLTQLRNEIRAEMARKKTVQENKLKHLIKVYSAMKPQKAASLIEKLEMGFAVEILSNMKGDIVGSILSFVDTGKAAKISEELAKQK